MKLKIFTIFVSTLQTSAVINDPENDPIVIIPSSANPRWLHFDPSIRIVFGTLGQVDSGRIF